LAREFPQNDYMGPSADLRAATIAPIPESIAPAPIVVAPVPAPIVVAPVALEAAPAVAERAPEAVVSAAPVAERPYEATLAPAAVRSEPAAIEAAPIEPAVIEAAPISEVAPVAQGPVAPLFQAEPNPEPVAMRIVFPRNSLEQGCAPRSAFRCALPIAETCSPAPRRTSLRPNVQEHAAGESITPNTLRGIG